MEASVGVCSPPRPLCPCHPENPQNSRDGLVKPHVWCMRGARGACVFLIAVAL